MRVSCRSIYNGTMFHLIFKVDVPEWLSGMTRNHVGFARAGSNPAVHDFKVLFSLSFPPNLILARVHTFFFFNVHSLYLVYYVTLPFKYEFFFAGVEKQLINEPYIKAPSQPWTSRVYVLWPNSVTACSNKILIISNYRRKRGVYKAYVHG